MANATLPQTAATRTTSRQRKPLSAPRVYQAWSADVSQHGRRGSYRRTAELVGCTPEYIRQLVAKHEQAHTLKPELFTVHELDYLPAPGETPLSRPVQRPPTASTDATPSLADAFHAYVNKDHVVNVNTGETGELSQLATGKQPQATEPEPAPVALVDLATPPPLLPPPSTTPALSATVKHYAPRPATRPAASRLWSWLATQVNWYMVLALASVLCLVMAWKW